jgi:tRNA pseudouridine55 synthase
MIQQDSARDYQKGEVLLIDKPLEWSSFDVVKKIRNLLCRKLEVKKIKVGHAGTLDPLASGLMIICTGKATKQIESFQSQPKEYLAQLKLGQTTPSFDLETGVNQEYPTEHINLELIENTLKEFTGEILQVPPLYSAKRLGGKRAYEFAREGSEMELEPVQIRIHELDLLNYEDLKLNIRVRCSKGTYIRSLANDLGKALNSGAYLAELRRTAIGDFRVENATTLKKFEENLNNM